ncbi:MAG: glycosyltransferase [Thermoplasmatales archaeon]|nr:glycosyltransferase [Thermoplasmatales archaeon]
MKNISKNIRDRLELKHNILALNSRDVLKKAFLDHIRAFQPEIIHYLHGPTIRTLIILKIAKLLSGNRARTICSATKPYFSKVTLSFLPLLRPNLVLTQSLIWEEFFKTYGFNVKFFPNGIDTSKFILSTSDEKLKIREKWGILSDKFVVLHVGHIRRNRNLEVFKQLQEIPGLQVVIVGGTANPANEALKSELISCGCRVYHHYISDISEVYKMADLYVFPTKYRHNRLPQSYNEIGAIDMPLSVLEAMSTDLPVITTRFGALPRIFEQGKGFHFCSKEEEILRLTMRVMKCDSPSMLDTREQALSISWGKIIPMLEGYYETLLKN